MSNKVFQRIVIILSLILLSESSLHGQIIIKDTVQIIPKPNHPLHTLASSFTQPIRFELSWNGGLNG
ncbi:MAG: hypothetical protein AB1728_15280 [Bacteroidota bacterium]